MNQLGMACLAMLIEAFVGYPLALQNTIGHPVQWMGRLINYLDEGLNDSEANPANNRLNGILALIALLICCTLPAGILAYVLTLFPGGWVINVVLAIPLIAQKSLGDHVRAVALALPRSIAEARAEVGKIVGRDPQTLDEGGIAKAALESLAENASDGVVAPVCWYALLGLPGLVAYKAINTADSMIGDKSEKYLNFGWASARLDDIVNLPASRLTGFLFAGAAAVQGTSHSRSAYRAMRLDADKHQSPNAGWPEAAMAGALDLSFGGPRTYQGELVNLPHMGEGRSPRDAHDIERGLSLFHNAMALLLAAGAILAIVL